MGETSKSFLDRLGLWVQMEFVLNQFPRDSRHVSRHPCEDVSIALEKFGESEFLFGIQGVAYVSNLGRFLHRQWYLLAKCVLRLDGRFGGLGVRHDRVGGGGVRPRPLSAPGVLWILPVYQPYRTFPCRSHRLA
jgi:hypothetical protein